LLLRKRGSDWEQRGTPNELISPIIVAIAVAIALVVPAPIVVIVRVLTPTLAAELIKFTALTVKLFLLTAEPLILSALFGADIVL
jgi:hypothetical protein